MCGGGNPFESVGNFFEDAAEDSWNTITQLPGEIAGGITGSDKVKNLISPPTWKEMGKPGEAFYNDFNEKMGVLPPDWRQYAAPVVGTALNFIPGVGPLASAAFNTAYNAGGMQANNKGMDWGKVGKNALTNFGTAGATMGMNALGNAAKGAQATNAAVKGATAANTAAGLGGSAALNANRLAAAAKTTQAINALNKFGTAGMNVSRSLMQPGVQYASAGGRSAATPTTNATAQPGQLSMMDKAYNTAVGPVGQQLVNDTITSTLTPEESSPMDSFDPSGLSYADDGGAYVPKGSDIFNAFGDASINDTDQITEEQLNDMRTRLGANTYLQQRSTQDKFTPTGQVRETENTPYSTQMGNIQASAVQGEEDLRNYVNTENKRRYDKQMMEYQDQVNRARSQELIDVNEGRLTQAMINDWAQNPDTAPEVLRNLFIGENALRPIF